MITRVGGSKKRAKERTWECLSQDAGERTQRKASNMGDLSKMGKKGKEGGQRTTPLIDQSRHIRPLSSHGEASRGKGRGKGR